jgi:hypothetical protein
MFELFTSMMKEEWRIHSTIFGSLSFALFPVMIAGIAFMSTFLLPLFGTVIPIVQLVLITHALFLLLGVMVGGFGLLGNEVMNRRFGQASLLAYSARTLPLSERFIFLNFVIKDTVYYFILWVFPFVAGFGIASPILGISLLYPLSLLLTLTLTFLTGLAWVFLLSTIYARSKRAIVLAGLLLVAVFGGAYLFFGVDLLRMFPPLALFEAFSPVVLIEALLLIIVPFVIAVQTFTTEQADATKRYQNRLTPLMKRLSFFPYPYLAAKDLLDLMRTGAAVGQTIFSFLLPLGLMWFFLSLIGSFLPHAALLLLFAILTGVLASTMYTWITAFDTVGSYGCLPIAVRTIIFSKICTFSLLQVIPVVFLAILAITTGAGQYLPSVLVLGLAISFFGLAVTVYLTGLSPNVLIYDAKVLVTYLISMAVVIVPLIVLSFMNPLYPLAAVLLFIPAAFLVRRSYPRWEKSDIEGF